MKKRPVLHHLVILCFVVGMFFPAPASAKADTFTLPQNYHYAGLTFSDPLTYTASSNPRLTTNIKFTSKHTLRINKDDTMKPLEAIVLTPTVTQTPVTDSTTVIQPTPTIFTQPTTAISETQAPTVSPTPTQQPTDTPIASYTPVPESNAGGLNASDIFSMVNAYRAQQGLPAFQQDAKTCSLAQVRAPEVAGEVASGNFHAGLIAMNLPYWNTENIISMNSDQAAFNWWINDPIHHAAIVSNNTYSCVACSGNACAEEFTSYQAK